jgi:Beta-lactamase enzyme family
VSSAFARSNLIASGAAKKPASATTTPAKPSATTPKKASTTFVKATSSSTATSSTGSTPSTKAVAPVAALPAGRSPLATLTALADIAPEQAIFVAEIVGNKCKRIDGEDGGIPKPIAGAVSLYILGALSKAIEAGDVQWDETVMLTDAAKSMPSGELANERDGKKFTVKYLASLMMVTGDFTAIDLLIKRLGPTYIENSQRGLGITDPTRNTPLLSTKAWLQLKWGTGSQQGQTYAGLSVEEQRSLISKVEADDLPHDVARRIDPNESVLVEEVNWFASMEDLCRVQAAVRALADLPNRSELRGILVRSPSDVAAVDAKRWKSVQYTKGAEPGVFVQTWLLDRNDGRKFSVNVMMGSIAPVDEARTNATIAPMIDWLAARK